MMNSAKTGAWPRMGAASRLTMVILVAGALLLNGCSSFHRKGAKGVKLADRGLLDQSAAPGADGGAGYQPNSPINEGRVEGERKPFPEGAMNIIYFDYDKATLRPDQAASLAKNLQYLKDHAQIKVYIEGHTDERGTVEYNFALGNRRAEAIQGYFVEHGLDAGRITIGSKGKEQPVVPGHSETAFSKNRRAEFFQVD